MSADTDERLRALPTPVPNVPLAGVARFETPADLRFGPAPGNTMSPPWAAHMLALWFQAGSGKLPFADAVKATAVHFVVEGET